MQNKMNSLHPDGHSILTLYLVLKEVTEEFMKKE